MLDTAYWHTDCHGNTTKSSRIGRNTVRDGDMKVSERERHKEE